MEPVEVHSIAIYEDRSIAVPSGHVIVTGYVEIHKVRMACRDRMSFGDVKLAFEKRLQLGSKQPWPCPRGYWEDDIFVIVDGRHEYIATLMIGHSHLLVAWVAEK